MKKINKNKPKMTNNNEELLKQLELKDKENRNLLIENNILRNDIKNLKRELKRLTTFETIALIEQNNEKDKQISELKKLNEEQKRLSYNFKYEKIIQYLKKRIKKKD